MPSIPNIQSVLRPVKKAAVYTGISVGAGVGYRFLLDDGRTKKPNSESAIRTAVISAGAGAAGLGVFSQWRGKSQLQVGQQALRGAAIGGFIGATALVAGGYIANQLHF